jgi:hypothetical protein|tara:strand:+ start:1016 stop:1282 length:267 start_codon:yes stop_codon:yes gene_type:complete
MARTWSVPVKKMTLCAVMMEGKSQKKDIVDRVIQFGMEKKFLPKLSPKALNFIKGLICLGWYLDELKKDGLVANNGRTGAKARWWPTV